MAGVKNFIKRKIGLNLAGHGEVQQIAVATVQVILHQVEGLLVPGIVNRAHLPSKLLNALLCGLKVGIFWRFPKHIFPAFVPFPNPGFLKIEVNQENERLLRFSQLIHLSNCILFAGLHKRCKDRKMPCKSSMLDHGQP